VFPGHIAACTNLPSSFFRLNGTSVPSILTLLLSSMCEAVSSLFRIPACLRSSLRDFNMTPTKAEWSGIERGSCFF
jgi:hypothetical protein